MDVTKSTGLRVRFEPGKIRGSLLRAGATKAVADRVAHAVTERVVDGMPTRRITTLVRQQLQRENRALMYRYTLRDALLKLGPAGFSFEKYVASILQAHGYRATLPEELPGRCVRHEVDVVAEKDGKRIMIEAKFRNDFGYFVRLKDVMATWARFIDLNEGPLGKTKPFDEVWVVTNGKISTRSQAFGACRDVRLLGWNFPSENSFAQFVDHVSLYPVTVLHDLKPDEIARFSDKGIMLCREAAAHSPKRLSKRTGISQRRSEEIVAICRQVVESASPSEGGRDVTA